VKRHCPLQALPSPSQPVLCYGGVLQEGFNYLDGCPRRDGTGIDRPLGMTPVSGPKGTRTGSFLPGRFSPGTEYTPSPGTALPPDRGGCYVPDLDILGKRSYNIGSRAACPWAGLWGFPQDHSYGLAAWVSKNIRTPRGPFSRNGRVRRPRRLGHQTGFRPR